MRILEVILEGFKSYPHRTVFRNFDHSFNAITGLNGSGKSNFMDAIIFVLGISKNLSLLRISKLSELIYQGNTGRISKAEVTVVFDNSDSTNQPLGYEDCVTLTATRIIQGDKSKFYINGKTSKLKDFKELFKQVKLSTETPSFIVTQGRIAKIITLKPMELLDMIEDTVGTLLFKQKKIEVNKGIDKEMDQFMEYGNKIIKKVGPRLVKIRHDITTRAKIDRITAQIDKLEKKVVAVGIEFHDRKIKEFQLAKDKASMRLEVSRQKESDLNNEQNECEQKIEKKNNQEEKYQQLQEFIQENEFQEKEVTRLQNKLTIQQNNLTQYEQQEKKIQDQKTLKLSEIETAQNLLPPLVQLITDLEGDSKSKKQDIVRLQFSAHHDQGSLVRVNIVATEQEINQINNKLKQIQNTLNEERKDLEQWEQVSKEDINQKKIKLQKYQEQEQEILQKLNQINYQENKLKELNMKLVKETNELKALKLEKDQPEYRNINISEQVKQILPQKFEFETLASRCRFKRVFFEQYKYVLNECMMAPLGIVICETIEQANILCKFSMKLFDNRSVTIQTKADFNYQSSITQQIEQEIRNEARQNQQKIIFLWELLDIEPAYQKFFDQQFKWQVIIENLKEKGFGQHLANTYGLKVYNPAGDRISDGIASGGYKGENQDRTKFADLINKFHGILERIENHKESIKELQIEIDQLSQKQNPNKKVIDEHQKITKTIQLLSIDIQKAEKQLNTIQQKKDEIKSLEEEEKQWTKKLEEQQNTKQEFQNQLLQCKEGQKVDKDYIAKQIKSIEVEIADLNRQLDIKQKAKDEIEDQIKKNERLIEQYEEEFTQVHGKKTRLIENIEEQVKYLEKQQDFLSKRLEEQKKLQDQFQDYENMNLEYLQEQLERIKLEIVQLQQARPAIIKEINKHDEEIKMNKNEISQFKQHYLYEQITYEMRLGKYKINMEEGLSKFEDNKDQIVQYRKDIKNFQKSLNYKKLSQKQIELSENFDNIGREIKSVFATANQLRQELEDCEEIREFAVRRCVAKVSEDFSMIFKTLYPYASAELNGIGQIFTEKGLEVIIKIEGKQKPLSQLSGGQKSLLAVALLMAQLRYFPSPFYLLDEIDSALDIEHTEKLGLIFATHFKTAQFILISLKSQMFNSAPVIFNVSQQGGVSSIQREEGRKDEMALKKLLKGHNINMEEHQQIEEKRIQQAEQFKQAKQRKNKLKKDSQQYEEEQAKENQLDNQPHWVRFTKSKKYLEVKQKYDRAIKNETFYKPVSLELIEQYHRLEAECYIRMKYQTEEEFLRIPKEELEKIIDKTIHIEKLVMDEAYFDKKVAEWNEYRSKIIKEKTMILVGKMIDIPDKLNNEERKQFLKDKAKKQVDPAQYLYEQRIKEGKQLEEEQWSSDEKIRKRKTKKKKQPKKTRRQKKKQSDSD